MLGCLPNTFAGGPSPTPSSTDRKPGALVTLDPADNVAIAVRRIGAGEPCGRVTAREEIRKGHKIALSDIEPGAQLCKYAQVIGYASGAIAAGSHVHVHNVEFRNTGQDYEFCVDLRDPGAVPPEDRAAFRGFRRANGKVGTRNYVAVLTSVNCSATAARLIAAAFTPETLAQYPNVDGVVAFVHGTGRGSAYGCKPSPCIKIASNSDVFDRMPEDMDVNAGRFVSDGASIEEVGEEIFRLILDTASGEPSLSEAQGLGDYEFVPWQVGATM